MTSNLLAAEVPGAASTSTPDLTVAPTGKRQLRKLTVLLEPDLAQTLMVERARIAVAEGVNVSLTSLATRAMRQGFAMAAGEPD